MHTSKPTRALNEAVLRVEMWASNPCMIMCNTRLLVHSSESALALAQVFVVVGDRVLEVPEEERPPREEFLGSARGGGWGWGNRAWG